MASSINLPSTTYVNINTATYSHTPSVDADLELAQNFHKTQLPDYNITPLTPLPQLAAELGLKSVYVKDESCRFGLPSFKVLGASWAMYRKICQRSGLPLTASLAEVGAYARREGIVLYAATDGNHGRAVARMGKNLGIRSRIYVPRFTDDETRSKISSEDGSHVIVVAGDYDAAVAKAWDDSSRDENGVHVQDNAFANYEEVPRWVVQGYSTMMAEIDEQLAKEEGGLRTAVIVTPIGVGSLGHAVVAYCKSSARATRVLTVEPESAACLNASLRSGKATTVRTGHTIMDGMCCPTVSPISWPVLRDGVDVSVTITDSEDHEAVKYLHEKGVMAGPCGAAPLAALRKIVQENKAYLDLGADSVVVLLCTEAKRGYTKLTE